LSVSRRPLIVAEKEAGNLLSFSLIGKNAQAARADAAAFVRSFVCYAGRRGVYTLVLVGLSSLLEGMALLAVVPLLAVAGGGVGHGVGGGWILAATERFFSAFHIASTEMRLGVLLGFFALVGILRAVLLSYRQLAVMKLQLGFMTREVTRIVSLFANAPWQKISRMQHARINYLFTSDIGSVATAGAILIECVVAVVMLAIQSAVAFMLSPAMTLICLVLLAAGSVAMLPLIRGSHRMGQNSASLRLGLLHNTGQFLGALKLAVGQNLQGKFVRMFASTFEELNQQSVDFAQVQKKNRIFLTVAGMAVAGMAVVAGIAVFHIAPAILVALLLVFTRMSAPVTQLQQQTVSFVGCMPAYRKLREMQRDLAVPASPPGATSPVVFNRAVAFRGVTYLHERETEDRAARGVRALDLVLRQGDFLGIAGTSGAGKTTLADLLVGLYAPQSGGVFLDGVPADLSRAAGWRERLSYVSQDAVMFNETLRESLLWANEKASEADIAAALRVAGADAVVARMPQGLDTVTGERGTLISGGERQRFAIARALLRRPQLLILDEATNAIDLKGERALLERLDALRPALTIVLIGHRVESLSLCNRVVLMNRGTVAAEGSFDALYERLSAVHD
jgi:ATP-binding cassette subfamily C protein